MASFSSGPTSCDRTSDAVGMTDFRTIDHQTIRRWAEERGMMPAVVEDTAKSPGILPVLHLTRPGDRTTSGLADLSWSEFFEMFEQRQLTLVYQDATAAGVPSEFYLFVDRLSSD